MFLNRVLNRIKRDCNKLKDLYTCFIKYPNASLVSEMTGTLSIDIDKLSSFNLFESYESINTIKTLYFSHRFDLLGSGWVENNHGSQTLGCVDYHYDCNLSKSISKPSQLVSIFHKNKSRKIERFISKDYQLIDWQKDIKSGYRWSEKQPYFKALKVIGKLEGVDIKLPWELSRLQHLTQLALLVTKSSLDEQDKAKQEFYNVCLDFFASNPTGMGVNWACAMDVAIRASNLITAKSLFSNFGTEKGFNSDFENIFASNIYQHGKFIYSHLEYNSVYPERNNNHYLSNISGLIFCGSFFLENATAQQWLSFAKKELLICIDKQFHDDGSNFEASTSYHRLSGELVIYSIAVLLNLYGTEWVEKYLGDARLRKLYKIGLFTKAILKPDGTIPQIGDNDSGRFFKIDLCGELITAKKAADKYISLNGYLDLVRESEPYWDQCCLNHTSFINVFDTIFRVTQANSLEANLIMMLSGGNTLATPELSSPSLLPKICEDYNPIYTPQHELVYESTRSLDSVEVNNFPDFGLFILKCEDHFYCSIYYGGVGQAGNGGHAHADFGSYDLIVDGVDIAKDPGAFLYTPSKRWRDIFRAELHNGFAKEHYNFKSSFSCDFTNELLKVNLFESGISMGVCDNYRVISVQKNKLVINTSCRVRVPKYNYYSPSYGVLTN